jgi:anthranilate synthase component 1
VNAPQIAPRIASKRLTGSFDAQGLFMKLRRSSATQSELFFERTGGTALIMTSAALNILCDGTQVRITCLNESASGLLEALRSRLSSRVAGGGKQELLLEFPRCEDSDEEVRLLADNPFTALRAIRTILTTHDNHEPFGTTLLGAIGFDHIDMFESLGPRPPTASAFPDFEFWLADGLVIVEPDTSARIVSTAYSGADPDQSHRQHHLSLERLAGIERRCLAKEATPADNGPRQSDKSGEPVADMPDSEYERIVEELQTHVAAGDIFQAVPSRTFNIECADALLAFERLRALDPSAYRFFMSSDWGELFGSSPETAVRLLPGDHGLTVLVSPIAGTRPRGSSADHDDRMRAELMLDQKEIAEHMMLVDLARNDVARVSRPGTRRVTELMQVQSFASVIHLVSRIEGTLAVGLDAFDALRACAVAGTLSGAPKLKAIELIRSYERSARGPYGGVALWINSQSEMDSAIIIRSALVTQGIAQVRAGAGIVHDSIPSAESQETRAKAASVLRAIGEAA